MCANGLGGRYGMTGLRLFGVWRSCEGVGISHMDFAHCAHMYGKRGPSNELWMRSNALAHPPANTRTST